MSNFTFNMLYACPECGYRNDDKCYLTEGYITELECDSCNKVFSLPDFIGLRDRNQKQIKVGDKVRAMEKSSWHEGIVTRAVNGRYFILCKHDILEFKWGCQIDDGVEII